MAQTNFYLRQWGIAISFSLLAEHSSSEVYAHELTRSYIWPDLYPSLEESKVRALARRRRPLWEDCQSGYITQARQLAWAAGCNPRLLGSLVKRLTNQLSLRQVAARFLKRAFDARATILVFSPMVLGYNVIPKLIHRFIPGSLCPWHINYLTNGVSLGPRGRIETWCRFPVNHRPVDDFVTKYHTLVHRWMVLADWPSDALAIGEYFPDHRVIGVCDPQDYRRVARWDGIADALATRTEVFSRAISLMG